MQRDADHPLELMDNNTTTAASGGAIREPSKRWSLSVSASAPSASAPMESATLASSALPPAIGGFEEESPKSPRADVGRTKSQSRRTLGNWQLGKTIGQGSMGKVRLGVNLTTGEQVCSISKPRNSAAFANEERLL